MADDKNMVRVKNVSSVQVGGVEPGETVELDTTRVNIAALVEAGYVEVTNKADAEKVQPFSAPIGETTGPGTPTEK